MAQEAAMQVTVNHKRIQWDSRKVICPSGAVVPTERFGTWLRCSAKWVSQGYDHFQKDLDRAGLTVADVQALQQSQEPLTRQLLSSAADRVRCGRCGRVLWDPDSIRRGVGPECMKRR